MDFSFTEEQDAIRDLAKQILEDRCTHEHLKAIEATGERFDRSLWSELAKANLVGIALPEDVGGSGLGLIELSLVLEQVGRAVAPVPYLATAVMAAAPIARFGSDAQRRAVLPGVVEGTTLATAALVETGAELTRPVTAATRQASRWRLDGQKICVPGGTLAERILVPATTPEGDVGVFLVDASAPGLAVERQDTTSGIPEAMVTLSDVSVGEEDALGDLAAGAEILEWMVQWTTVGLCATTVGVCEEALRMTAEYTKTREQFDRPIATFQAVGQRAADAYIDTEAIRLTTWQAAWRLATGIPAAEEVAVAKFWAAEGGQRVVHAAQHLHGGIGVDRDYPLHRYFLWAKQLELTLGGATPQLLELGALLAADPG
jgi:3-oxocholest-4-en-26-oyl-CoA dehydrogenase beta subunit